MQFSIGASYGDDRKYGCKVMSVQFGQWSSDPMPPLPSFFEKLSTVLGPYGPDRCHSYEQDGVVLVFRALDTTQESRREIQPHISRSGAVLMWDGRLDNRSEFLEQFAPLLSPDSTDVAIVAAAYDRWGTGCFPRLIGDWAVSIWDPREHEVILAKDVVGTRHLYYSSDSDCVCWSTILDPLLLLAEKAFDLNQEYVAGWFSFFPETHLTPYVGIHAVPPSCYVRLEKGRCRVTKYWDFDPHKRIRCRNDAEYEEQFRLYFANAVRRRLRSDTPVLAELSGGLDSSSIVCMADRLIAQGTAETTRLDTVSYFDDTEPNWNERPYFMAVEENRGRTGCHIDLSSRKFHFAWTPGCLAATPGSPARPTESSREFAASLAAQGNRVVLSGIGGDEVTGGVPTPTPELEDLLARARFGTLAHQLKNWSLNKKTPWFHLFIEAARRFVSPSLFGVPKYRQPAAWLHPDFVKLYRAALTGYPRKVKLFGPLPSFQENISTLDALRRQLAATALSSSPPYEKRYPYLDRTLLEFLYAIPREQLVRPGQRRSLMRRALVGIVPADVLNRRRKAFVVRRPLAAVTAQWAEFSKLTQDMVSASIGMVDPSVLLETLKKAQQGEDVPLVTLVRTLSIELWLRAAREQGILKNGDSSVRASHAFRNRDTIAELISRKNLPG
jgi:asparagine synthase (glutamine-hydrolysing)